MMDLDEVYNSTIKKTQSLLESKGIALSLREIKKLDTINLSGFRNDGERLLRLELAEKYGENKLEQSLGCLLYTSPSPRDGLLSRMPSSA